MDLMLLRIFQRQVEFQLKALLNAHDIASWRLSQLRDMDAIVVLRRDTC